MAKVIVLGAGLTGLSAALLLARDGHEVTVLERDPAEPGSPGSVWADWDRPGVNQFRLPHFLLPRWRQEMAAELPDVLDALTVAGAFNANLLRLLPTELRGPLQPSDERFTAITARRPVLEAVLSEICVRTPGLTVRRGAQVTGLVSTGTPTEAGRVTGVLLSGGRTLRADLVVDCGGRRSALPSWLAAIGMAAPEPEQADCGFVYYGMHLRGRMPEARTLTVQHYDSLTVVPLPADNDTWSVVLVTSSRDKELRPLRDQRVFDAVLAQYPYAAHWRDGEPLAGVAVMAGIEDRLRRLSADGVVAIGDAWGATNPSLGRGASIGLIHARLLRDELRSFGSSGGATGGASGSASFGTAFAARTAEVVEPLYRMTLWFDHHRLAEIDADIAGDAYWPDDPRWTMSKALYAAALRDPELLRHQADLGWLLRTGEEVFGTPGVAPRVMAVAGDAPQYPLGGPDRAALLKVVREASA